MINRGLSPEKRKRFALLETKRSAGSLTEEEHEELLALSDELEQLNVDRVQYLGQLASLRGISVRALMKQLGIHPAPLHD